MAEKMIKKIELPSGLTAIAFEAEPDTLALEVGSGIIFLKENDIYPFTRLLKEADRRFLTGGFA